VSNVNYVVFTIVVVLFLLVTLIGFAAARWRRAEDRLHLNEWGLGGRGYGTFIGRTTTSRRPTSSAGGSGRAACRSPRQSPASSR